MLYQMLEPYRIILGSQSPRRYHLMKEAGFSFVVENPAHEDESYPINLSPRNIAIYLAEHKANHITLKSSDEILITADTIVVFENKIFGKPQNSTEAFEMLKKLSGQTHEVITGVCLRTMTQNTVFSDTTLVTFRKFKDEEIYYYIDNFKPYDKAGSYGAQDWIGLTGIVSIRGSYFNVMGLPMHKLYEELEKFIMHLQAT